MKNDILLVILLLGLSAMAHLLLFLYLTPQEIKPLLMQLLHPGRYRGRPYTEKKRVPPEYENAYRNNSYLSVTLDNLHDGMMTLPLPVR
ncbi:hypothetical protein Entas_4642 (plasmid) [Enterobacter soli]|uniref:hypothetical protein n=1 Tax=Enterobacter soli TaxID=885040 RepID=UPI000223D389|nr:hypothetical protein [Enterobacter soli]AEN67318.1 hypothetical protein Entas_4642 [Enterobacter soli]OAT35065.1 hypothetical protein M987_04518 [Enterobacter soli ATCC BAA-2102]